MRTPWRFLADLVSRKTTEDTSEDQRWNPSKTHAIEFHPEVEEQLQEAAPEAPEKPAEADQTISGELSLLESDADSRSDQNAGEAIEPWSDATVPPHAEQEPSDKQVSPLEPETQQSDQVRVVAVAPTTRRARGTRETFRETPGKAADRDGDVELQHPVPKTLFGEMSELDEEIAVLRHKLARKLVEQNAQLRKMLARFDAE